MIAAIKSLIYAEEFFPFRILHKKGQTYNVTNREYCWVALDGVYVIHTPKGTTQQIQEILNPSMIEKVATHEDSRLSEDDQP